MPQPKQHRLMARRRSSRIESLEARLAFAGITAFDGAAPFLDAGTAPTYFEDQAATVITSNAKYTPDTDFNPDGSIIRVTIDGATSSDVLGVHAEPGEVDQLHIAENGYLEYNGNRFGSFTLTAAPSGTEFTYKTVGDRALHVYVTNPPASFSGPRPAVLIFHGGGWATGDPADQNRHARYLASRGMVAIEVEYRFADPGVPEIPLDSIHDAKSAMRWVRENASNLNVNPNQIAAAGVSAGGHLAGVAGMIDGLDDPSDDLTVSAKANAVILISGIVSNGPEEFGYFRFGDQSPQYSPADNVSTDDPPTIGFWGTADTFISQQSVQTFKQQMDAAGVRCDVNLYDGLGHGFAAGAWNNPYFYDVMQKADRFLSSLGWIQGEPTIVMPASAPLVSDIYSLNVYLGSLATPDAVQSLVRNITFQTKRADAGLNSRTIDYSFADGSGIVRAQTTQALQIQGNNDSPILKSNTAALMESIAQGSTNSQGALVSALVANRITDPDPHALFGIAVVSQTSSQGSWQYSRDNGQTWRNMGVVSGSAARLLPADNVTRVRFVPDPAFFGTAKITFVAWDQTQGQAEQLFNTTGQAGGEHAFSAVSGTATQPVQKANSAPSLKTASPPAFNSIAEDAANPSGTYLLPMLADRITDIDANPLRGIAVSGATLQGTWQYSLDAGGSWKGLGPVSVTNARLIPVSDQTLVRYIPMRDFNGTAQLYYRAWDQTQGVAEGTYDLTSEKMGGTSAFSLNIASSALVVNPVNDAPNLKTAPDPHLPTISAGNPNGSQILVSSLIANAVTDSDANSLMGIAIFQVSSNTQGQWRFSLDAGATWKALGPFNATSARLLPANDRTLLRFIPAAGFTGDSRLFFRAWDQTVGVAGGTLNLTTPGMIGGTGAISQYADYATVTVKAISASALDYYYYLTTTDYKPTQPVAPQVKT